MGFLVLAPSAFTTKFSLNGGFVKGPRQKPEESFEITFDISSLLRRADFALGVASEKSGPVHPTEKPLVNLLIT